MTAPVRTAQALADVVAYVETLDLAETLGEAQHALRAWDRWQRIRPAEVRDPMTTVNLVLFGALVRQLERSIRPAPPGPGLHSCQLLGRVIEACLSEQAEGGLG